MNDSNSTGSARNVTETQTTIELVPRRIFLRGAGAVGLSFIVPSCASKAAPDAKAPEAAAAEPAPAAEAATESPAPAAGIASNADWEGKAQTLEAGGQGRYSAKETKDQAGKEGKHVPTLALTGSTVKITTTHPTEAVSEKKPKGHFISHHYLRDDESGLIFAWKEYDLKPGETAATDFELPPSVKSFTAFQVCNLHWTWASDPQAKA